MADHMPLYNLKAVIKEVGINPVTLRAWERRYDLLKPKRTTGGHRLYSRQDIEMLKWLIDRQAEGLSISSAIEMWKSQLPEYRDRIQGVQTPVPEIGTGDSTLDNLCDRWVSACLSFDDLTANRVLDEAFAITAPEMIIDKVILKGLARVGESWYKNTVSVQQEHFTSAIAARRIHTLLTAVAPPTRPGQILAACPPGEEHDFVLLIISYLLRRRGWEVVYLGSNVPLIDLDTTIRSTSPVLFLSAAQTLKSAASLKNLAEYMITQAVPMAYGGGIFNQVPIITQCISGYHLGTDLLGVSLLVERIIHDQPPMPVAQDIPLDYTRALTSFLEYEAAIIAHVSSIFRTEIIKSSHLENATQNFSQFIASALTLGDITLLDHTNAALDHLLHSYGLTAPLLNQYYDAYRQAVERYLGEAGKIILDWFEKYEIFV